MGGEGGDEWRKNPEGGQGEGESTRPGPFCGQKLLTGETGEKGRGETSKGGPGGGGETSSCQGPPLLSRHDPYPEPLIIVVVEWARCLEVGSCV